MFLNMLLRGMFCLLLGAIAVCGQFVTNSSYARNISNATTASSATASKCLHRDDDERIQEFLISPKNYYNISRAIYPSIDIPSLYVKIIVQFNSSTTNGSSTVGNPKQFTWSKSCLYVATEFVSLYAMSVYSLGTICPQRRETELFITLPAFCNDTEDERINSKMTYFLSTLEDIAVIPTAQDPRLNTVECVVKGHDSFDVKIFSGFRKLLMHVCWFIGFISVVFGYLVSNILVERLKEIEPRPHKTDQELEEITAQSQENQVEIPKKQKDEKKCKTVSLKFLLFVIAVPEGILLIVAVVLAVDLKHSWRELVYPVAYLVIVIPLTSIVYYRKFTVNTEDTKIRLRNTFIHFSFQTNVHHLLWIILGIMTEPLWAIPVLVIICGVLFWIHLLAYYYMKTIIDQTKCNKNVLKLRAILLVLSVIFEFLVLVVVAQSFLGTDPVIGIVSSALTAFVSWWVSITVKKGIIS